MHIGFTGTQNGMTDKQFRELAYTLLEEWGNSLANEDCWFHSGDCIGADEEAVDLAERFGYLTWGHPPDNPTKRSRWSFHRVEEPKPYLDRNHDIVDASHLLIAAPKGPEELRSGTWSTVRYARKLGTPVIILEP